MKRLDAAEAEARTAVDEWIAASAACAAYPGVGALQMFEADQKMVGRLAQAYEVETPAGAAFYSAWGLAWSRSSLETTFSFSSWTMPWASADMRMMMLQRMTERFAEAAITAFRARSKLG